MRIQVVGRPTAAGPTAAAVRLRVSANGAG